MFDLVVRLIPLVYSTPCVLVRLQNKRRDRTTTRTRRETDNGFAAGSHRYKGPKTLVQKGGPVGPLRGYPNAHRSNRGGLLMSTGELEPAPPGPDDRNSSRVSPSGALVGV